MVTDSEFETQLREEFETRSPRPLPEALFVPRPRRRVLWVAAAVMLVVLGSALLLKFVFSGKVYAVAEAVDGEMYRVSADRREPIRIGERVGVGETILAESNAALSLSDGSRIEMAPQSELSLERVNDAGVRLFLTKGSIIVNAAGQHSGKLDVRTKDMTASVVGTVCFVKAEESGSRVAALGGEVRVQQGTTEKNLQPGGQLATNPLMAFIPLREQISWSRDAEARKDLLQRFDPPPLPAPPLPGPATGDGLAFIKAARGGLLETVRRLLDRGADPNVAVPGEGSPLIAAARAGHMDVVRLLLDRRADPNMPVPAEGNPLIAAAGAGRADVVTLLLDRGAKIEEVVPGDENALITASGEGRLNIVRLLVSRGANVNARVWSGSTGPRSSGEWRTPLSHARKERRDEVVEFLLSLGARE